MGQRYPFVLQPVGSRQCGTNRFTRPRNRARRDDRRSAFAASLDRRDPGLRGGLDRPYGLLDPALHRLVAVRRQPWKRRDDRVQRHWTVRGDGTGFPNPFNDVLYWTDSFKYDPSKGDLIVEFDVHSSARTSKRISAAPILTLRSDDSHLEHPTRTPTRTAN